MVEYAVRFFFGGAICVVAAILAKQFGPAFGGLFLAFPAIFPASGTLVEKHERQKKAKAGISATLRGRQSVALVVWKFPPQHSAGIVLCAVTIAWLAASLLGWSIRQNRGWRVKKYDAC